MTKKTSPHKVLLALLIAVFSLFHLFAKKMDESDLDFLYKMAQFSRIAAILEGSGFESLTLQDKLLYIECLAKSAQRNEAAKLFQETMADHALSCQTHTTAGIVHTSRGQFVEAEDHLKKALALDPECPKAWMAMMTLELYMQNHEEARNIYEEIKKRNPEWAESYLFHLLGIEVYGALGDIAKIAELHELQADKIKKFDKKQHLNFQKTFRLYRKESKKKAFQSQTATDKVNLPFVELTNKDSYAAIPLKIKDKLYKVLLDTGNRAGWTIHSRELEKGLKHRLGGTVLTQIGGEEGMLHGDLLLTKRVAFQDFTLNHLPGMYIPKPHPDYPDANLNPLFIKDRVVTLDFRNKELILRTKEWFQEDLALASAQPEKTAKLPWYGYEQAFIPVLVNKTHEALAMIETGAEDITVNLDFARWHGLDLKPAVRYLSTGKEFPYHSTSCLVSIGQFRMQREAADVWFFHKLPDPITGLMPDILLGPNLFKDRFVLTFDPYQKIILISEDFFPQKRK
jgi:tetratricopeptide (TPR) repeat protein